MEEFNLSKTQVCMNIGVRTNIPNIDQKIDLSINGYYKTEDVVKFIRLLKAIDFEGYYPEKIIEEIDKLAGDDLIEKAVSG